ncbi:unnamed protein product [Danaus chrysippus]|uniref:(African queen) hypothetical protein n=1 Tax=Danaus chrysippus TaxID=151541 RepID=A0A8J2QPX2_9NEOP|nr:unnamed protein product [Danaus chrysippus]
MSHKLNLIPNNSNRSADENNSEDESPDRALSSGIGPSMPSFNENSKLGAVSVAGPSGSIPQPGVTLRYRCWTKTLKRMDQVTINEKLVSRMPLCQERPYKQSAYNRHYL